MDAALVLSALLMGLAGSPHCIAMCGAACSALTRSCGGVHPARASAAFHVGRLLSYMAGGAIAASSVSALAVLGQSSPVLRPFWTLVHVAALGLGLLLLWNGRQPAWLSRIGRPVTSVVQPPPGARIRTSSGPTRAFMAGALWLAWPCGLLQSTLVVAALANSPAAGAGVMGAFAVASSVGLWAGPALWWRLNGAAAIGSWAGTWSVRLAGASLAAVSVWSLGRDLWPRVAAYCFG